MSVIGQIVEWGNERGITTQTHNTAGFIKNIVEELAELIEADKLDDQQGRIDAICDIVVFCVTELPKLHTIPEAALLETFKEINSRTGGWSEEKQKWIKDTSEEAQARWYKANYAITE